MAEDIASLGIKVDASQVDKAQKSLNDLSKAGKDSEKSANSAGESWGAFAKSLINPTTSILVLGAAFVGLGVKALQSAEDGRISMAKMELVYKNSGKNIGVTLAAIESQIQGLSKTTIFDDDSLRDSAREFVKFGNISGNTLKSLINTTAEYATLTGQDVVQAAHSMAIALADPEAAARLLKEAGIALTNTEKDYIKALIETGRQSEAQALLADKLANAYQGTTEALQGTGSVLKQVRNEFGGLIEAVGNSPIGQFISDFAVEQLKNVLGLLTRLTNLVGGAGKGGGASGSFGPPSKGIGSGFSGSWGEADLLVAKKTEEQMKKEIDAVKELGKEHTKTGGVRKSHVASMSEQQKAQKALDDQYKSLVESMEKELALILVSGADRELAALDYDLQNGSLRKLNATKKEYLLGLQQEINSRELEAKGNEAKKEELANLTDEYNKLTLSALDYFKLTLTTKGIAPDQQGELIGKFNKVQSAEAEKQKIDAAKEAVKAYSEEIDKASDSLSALRDISSSVFDGALGGINLLIGAVDNITKSLKENQAAIEENQKAIGFAKLTKDLEAQEKFKKQDLKLTQEKTAREVDGARQIAGATAKLFGEKTSAAKSFHALEIALSVASIAMRAKEMAATLAQTVISVAAGAAKFFEQSGWFGFAGVAGMIAVMASLGFGSRGGGTVTASATGTGTILGDKTAVSESTSKTYQLLKDIHAEEYAELRGINQGIRNLNGAINDTITRIFQAGGINADPVNGLGLKGSALGSLADPVSSFLRDIPVIGGFIGGIQDFVFGSTKKSIEAFGIQLGKIDIAKILEGAIVDAQQFTTVKTVKKGALGGLFGGSKTSFEDILSPLDKGVTDNLTAIFKNVGLVMVDVAKALGGNLEQSVRKYVLPAVKIDLKDLSGEEALKKLTGVISAQLDNMASSVFGKIVGKYQKLGEGMLETAIRIVAEVAIVRDALGKSGLRMAKDAIALSDALIQAAGGMQEFQKQFGEFYDKFFTDQEKQRDLQKSLTLQLKEVGEALPKTRQGYRLLLESLDLNNKKDQERYTLLLKLSSAADKYYKTLEELQSDRLDKLFNSLTNAITRASNVIKERISFINGLLSSLSNAYKSITQGAIGDNLATRRQAQQQLNDLLQLAIKGGKRPVQEQVDAMLSVLTKPSEQFFKTAIDFKRDAFQTAGTIDKIIKIGQVQVTDAQKQLKALENIQSAAQKQIDAINGVSTAVYSVRSALLSFKSAIGPVAAKKIPKFANGGYHDGGFAIVGEDGPELVNMPAGRIFSNTTSRKMVDNSELINEIRQLRNEVKFLRAASEETARTSRKTSDTLTRVTRDGDSLLTTAA